MAQVNSSNIDLQATVPFASKSAAACQELIELCHDIDDMAMHVDIAHLAPLHLELWL